MNWKSLIVAFILLSLTGLFFFSKERSKDLVKSLKSKVGRFVEVVNLKKFVPSEGKRIPIRLEMHDSLSGQEFHLSESSLTGEFSIGLLSVDGKKIEVKNPKLELSVESLNGRITVDDNGVFSISGSAEVVEVGNFVFNAEPNTTLKLEINGIPFNFECTNVAGEFTFENVDGTMSVQNGEVVVKLSDGRIKLFNFKGNVSLKKENVIFEGETSKVKKTGYPTVEIY